MSSRATKARAAVSAIAPHSLRSFFVSEVFVALVVSPSQLTAQPGGIVIPFDTQKLAILPMICSAPSSAPVMTMPATLLLSYAYGVTGELQPVPGMTCGVWQMRPESKGFVRARTADPDDPPAIQPNYLIAETDRLAATAGLRWARRLLATRALAAYRGAETLPGEACRSDEALLAYARARGATVYHAVSTCRMGIDPTAVVAPNLKLKGMGGLRVVDASVMPTMVSANANAAMLMIAEKESDMIVADRRA